MPPLIFSPLIKFALGALGAGAIVHWAVKEVRRINEELDRVKQFLPTNQADLRERGWDQVDIIIVTGDAYVDHPAFGPVLIARFLEGRGFKVGLISQPDWQSAEPFKALGRPRLFFGVSAGNLDSIEAPDDTDKQWLHEVVRRHQDETGSTVAGKLLFIQSEIS